MATPFVCVALFLCALGFIANQQNNKNPPPPTALESAERNARSASGFLTSAQKPSGPPQTARQMSTREKHYERIRTQGKSDFVWVDPGYKFDPDVYEHAIAEIAGSSDFAFIFFWDDRDRIPENLPMSDEQLESQIAKYEANRNTGHEQFYYLRDGNMAEPFGNCPSTTPVPANDMAPAITDICEFARVDETRAC